MTNIGEDVEGYGTFVHCWSNCKLVQQLRQTVQRLFEKLKIELPYEPPICSGYLSNENWSTN